MSAVPSHRPMGKRRPIAARNLRHQTVTDRGSIIIMQAVMEKVSKCVAKHRRFKRSVSHSFPPESFFMLRHAVIWQTTNYATKKKGTTITTLSIIAMETRTCMHLPFSDVRLC